MFLSLVFFAEQTELPQTIHSFHLFHLQSFKRIISKQLTLQCACDEYEFTICLKIYMENDDDSVLRSCK